MPAVLALLWATAAHAQMPFGEMGGRRGRGGWTDRVVVGRVTDLNPVRGYIQVASFPSEVPRVIVTTADTQMVKNAEVPASDLRVGDRVTVAGVPVEVSAVRIGVLPEEPEEKPTVAEAAPGPPRATEPERAPADEGAAEGGTGPSGKPERPLPGAGMFGGRGRRPMGPPGMFSRSSRYGSQSQRAPGEWTATAVVKSLEPLTIELEGGEAVTLSVSEGTKITRPAPATMEDVHEGVVVAAIGERNDDGYLQAVRLFIGDEPQQMLRLVMREARRLASPGGPPGVTSPAEASPGGPETPAKPQSPAVAPEQATESPKG